jgi:hypothetical protein
LLQNLTNSKDIMRTKTILIALICIFSFTSVKAQMNPKIKLGLKIAPNLCFIIPDTRDYSYNGLKLGGILGLVSDFYFAEHYAFSTGFNFCFLGGKLHYTDKMKINDEYVDGTVNSNMSFIYLEIPLMIKMFTKKFGPCSFFGQIGFGTGFRLTAHAKNDFTGDDGSQVSQRLDITSQTTTVRESVIIGIGTEIHIDESTRIFAGISYSNSLNNVLKGYNSKSGANQKGFLNYAELNLGILF